MISTSQLARIMPRSSANRRRLLYPSLAQTMSRYHIADTTLRAAAFLAQIAHESGELRYLEELASGRAYEGREDLGNTSPGDGARFKGRGLIQLTGRANYAHYGPMVGADLIKRPGLAAQPPYCCLLAGAFWSDHDLNDLADAGDFKGITKIINGGLTHFDERLAYYKRALEVLT